MEKSSFLDELRRRRVLRLSGYYLAIAWVIIEVSATVFPALLLPDWSVTLVILLLIFGFPAGVTLAWFFDIGAGGIERTEDLGPSSPAQFWGLIAGTIAVAALGALAALHVYRSDDLIPDSAPAIHSFPITAIAVLPFDNFSGDVETGVFADGLSEELSAQLAQIDGLQVVSRTSAFFYRDAKSDIATIARQLRAGSVLEGSVRQSGERLRVTAQLINGSSGYHLWSANYNRTIDDIFEIQNDIARSVVAALEVLLAEDTDDDQDTAPPIQPRDYGLYLRARGYLRASATEQSLDKARTLFARAIDAAPKYAPAYSGLCQTLLANYRLSKSHTLVNEAQQACLTALAIDGTASPVQVALGELYLVKGESQRALQAFEAALGLDPDEVGAYRGLARAHAAIGEFDKAENNYRRSIEAQPGYWRPLSDYGLFLIRVGRYREAIANFDAAVALNPGSASTFNNLGGAHYLNGEFDLAARAYRRSLAIAPTRSAYSNTGAMHYLASQFGEARAMFEKATELAPDDARMWGNLADTLAQIPGMEKPAEAAYDEALRLVAIELTINPEEPRLLARAAWFRANRNQGDEARRLIGLAKSQGPRDALIFYNAGLIALKLKDPEWALADIGRALELGMSPAVVAATPELAILDNDKAFRALIGEAAPDSEGIATGD